MVYSEAKLKSNLVLKQLLVSDHHNYNTYHRTVSLFSFNTQTFNDGFTCVTSRTFTRTFSTDINIPNKHLCFESIWFQLRKETHASEMQCLWDNGKI